MLIAGMPDHKEGKLLGISPIPHGTGTTQAKISHDLVLQWGAEISTVGLVFDTIASNSGWKSGACMQLESFSSDIKSRQS